MELMRFFSLFIFLFIHLIDSQSEVTNSLVYRSVLFVIVLVRNFQFDGKVFLDVTISPSKF